MSHLQPAYNLLTKWDEPPSRHIWGFNGACNQQCAHYGVYDQVQTLGLPVYTPKDRQWMGKLRLAMIIIISSI